MEIKYCIDCKNFNAEEALCVHPNSALEIDYVFGRSVFISAKEMRNGKCGSEAKYFSSKNKFATRDWR